MGQDVRHDWAIPLATMHGLINLLEEEWQATSDQDRREQVTSIGAYSAIAFCGSFRGGQKSF
jgi:K+-sensing histidine kinase KdpD